jgi:hypothetical protein
MNFEELQKAWQSQGHGPQLALDANLLLKEVRRNKWHFEVMLFWRDTREVGVAAGLTVLFLFWGIRDRVWSLNWLALACLWVGSFMLVDRWRQRRKQPVTNDPLRSCIEASLIQVNHQIWLLKNVFWWYLLPLATGAGVFIISLAWEIPIEVRVSRGELVGFLLGSYALVCGLSFWLVYWLNQLAVRKHLEPRRQELESLLAGLDQ